MKVDVACLGTPFLDLIFRGLPAIPTPGREELARDLVVVPGAMANVAYALHRLGLVTVICAPRATDPAGRLLQALVEEAGIRWIGRSAPATPVSVAMPVHGDRAFVTVAPSSVVDHESLGTLEPRAVVVELPLAGSLPPLPIVYGVVGDPEVRALAGNLPATLAGLRALVLNDREVRHLAGEADEIAAARHLAALGTTVVVTCGSAGGFAVEPDGRIVHAAATEIDVEDTTGAGDLFTAAWIWADLDGEPLEQRLATAIAYASRSLAVSTTRQKGLTRSEFLEES